MSKHSEKTAELPPLDIRFEDESHGYDLVRDYEAQGFDDPDAILICRERQLRLVQAELLQYQESFNQVDMAMRDYKQKLAVTTEALQTLIVGWEASANAHHSMAVMGYPANRESYAEIYRQCAQELYAILAPHKDAETLPTIEEMRGIVKYGVQCQIDGRWCELGCESREACTLKDAEVQG